MAEDARHTLDELGFFFFFFTLDTGSERSFSPKLSDTRVYEPQIRARPGTTRFSAANNLIHETRILYPAAMRLDLESDTNYWSRATKTNIRGASLSTTNANPNA